MFAVLVAGCNCHDPVLVPLRDPVAETDTSSAKTPDDTTGERTPYHQPESHELIVDCRDLDGDGYGYGIHCLGLDCDDEDPGIGASGTRPCYTGPAGTAGVGACAIGAQSCVGGEWLEACAGDVHPSIETCDGADNDCDGETDEALVRACYTGPAGTEGVGSCAGGTQTCAAGDWSACEDEVLPSVETCDDVDNDCDGQVDQALVRACYTGPPGTEGVGICSAGEQVCAAGAWGACAGDVVPGTEVCDGLDNNCNGQPDEALVRVCYSGPVSTKGVGACSGGVQTCAAGDWGACAGEVTPIAETCDAVDNDCDGVVDEALVRACYSGPGSTEGVGACTGGTQTCAAGDWGSCAGEVTPSAETCDGVDNDCNGQVDQEVTQACYPGPAGTEGVGVCIGGLRTCAAGVFGACQGAVLPSPESCDGLDDNCNGSVDEKQTRFTQAPATDPGHPGFRPVDIVIVIDNSGTMGDEITSVENNINTNFAAIIGASGLDYRVIMLSRHGAKGGSSPICVSSPLSGNGNCANPATCPVNGARYFHYNVDIGTHSLFNQILSTYSTADTCGLAPGGWSGWLRQDSAKVFIVITDDGPNTGGSTSNGMTGAQFDSQLLALSATHFGTAAARNYEFHSIVGLKENTPATAPWLPSAPLVSQVCTGNRNTINNPGLEYQNVSLWSGGLRYPVCEFQSYDSIFLAVAAGILNDAKLLCEFPLAQIPSDSSPQNAFLELVPTNGGPVKPLAQVANQAACVGDAFYVVGTMVHLCPAACTMWQNDPTALVDVVYTCSNQVQP